MPLQNNENVIRVPKDCMECRLVGGSGLLGAASYVAYQGSKNTRPGGKPLCYIFALGMYYYFIPCQPALGQHGGVGSVTL